MGDDRGPLDRVKDAVAAALGRRTGTTTTATTTATAWPGRPTPARGPWA